MNKRVKGLSIIITVLIAFICFSSNASATEVQQDGLKVSISTDKETYNSNEDIQIKVTVTNTNSYSVNNVSLETLLPEGLKLKNSNTYLLLETIEAGESTELQTTAVLVSQQEGDGSSSQQSSDNINENSNSQSGENSPDYVQTGDTNLIIIYLLIVTGSAAILIFAIKYKKKAIKVLSLLLCVGMLIPIVSNFKANAVETERKNFTASKQVIVAEKVYNIKAKISYDKETSDTYVNLTIDQLDFTTTSIHESLSGGFESNENLISIEYYLNTEGDSLQNTKSQAIITGNRWSIDDILLKPNKNTIYITATTASGIQQTKKIDITFDRGALYS